MFPIGYLLFKVNLFHPTGERHKNKSSYRLQSIVSDMIFRKLDGCKECHIETGITIWYCDLDERFTVISIETIGMKNKYKYTILL